MHKLLFLFLMGILSLGFAAVSKEDQQREYNLAFASFRQNMTSYNNFVKYECYDTGFQPDCFAYMDRLNLLSNNKDQFLELVNLLSSPYVEDGSTYKDAFNPDNRSINKFFRIANQSLVELASSLSYLYGSEVPIQQRDKLVKLNQILMALNGSIIDTLMKSQQMRW